MSRRFCQALDLVDDPQLIAEYEAHHQRIWPAVAAAMRQFGIVDMEIYRLGNRLFMVVEVNQQFNGQQYAEHCQQVAEIQAWEALMWKYQRPTPWTADGEKWAPMRRIFALSEQPE
ncbi:L-rhamnose mutarotase [Paramixta manurensis]|uniref:L-rhamnose mutarotase n=1 Tax=Paramixta manurensis TaxID=2740817 RepID=A0A6M8UJT5_9GAMM|nr:L-rhamnose mutarotase [Erwiniaceae bacterium PD-1]